MDNSSFAHGLPFNGSAQTPTNAGKGAGRGKGENRTKGDGAAAKGASAARRGKGGGVGLWAQKQSDIRRELQKLQESEDHCSIGWDYS